MSLEVKSNKEIKKIKAEIFMGLGMREIIIFLAAIAVVGYLFLSLKFPEIVLTIITSPILAAATIIAVARPGGLPAEVFLMYMIRSLFINNRPLKYVRVKEEEEVKNVIKGNRKKRLY